MAILRALSRTLGVGTIRLLCTRYGATLVLVGALTCAASASLYLGQHPTQAVPSPTTTSEGGPGTRCGLHGHAYLADTNQFYCQPYAN